MPSAAKSNRAAPRPPCPLGLEGWCHLRVLPLELPPFPAVLPCNRLPPSLLADQLVDWALSNRPWTMIIMAISCTSEQTVLPDSSPPWEDSPLGPLSNSSLAYHWTVDQRNSFATNLSAAKQLVTGSDAGHVDGLLAMHMCATLTHPPSEQLLGSQPHPCIGSLVNWVSPTMLQA